MNLSNPDKGTRRLYTVISLMKENFFDLEPDEYVIFKDGNYTNLSLDNLKVVKQKEREIKKTRRVRKNQVQFLCLLIHRESGDIKMIYTPEELKRLAGLKNELEANEIFEKGYYKDETWIIKAVRNYCHRCKARGGSELL